MLYPYASIKNLSMKINYSYSPFHGWSFIMAWKANRKTIINKLKVESVEFSMQTKTKPLFFPCYSRQLISYLNDIKTDQMMSEQRQKILMAQKLLKSYEVTKKLFSKYISDIQGVKKNSVSEIKEYIGLAAVFNTYYELTGEMPFLNGLLKVIDTLVALFDDIPDRYLAVFKWLLEREFNHIQKLAKKIDGWKIHE